MVMLLPACNSYHYRIEDYNLTFEPRANSLDVKATIEITYFMDGKVSKNDGFKFVGTNEVDSLVCVDETRNLMSKIEYLKETRLSWHFEPVQSGLKKIKATFLLRNFLEKKGNNYVLKAPWAGVFRVPVSNARYNILLPATYKPLQFNDPIKWEHEAPNGKDCYYHNQSPLKDQDIEMLFGE